MNVVLANGTFISKPERNEEMMKKYKADDLTQQQIYKLLSGSVVPRPIAWLTTQNSDGLVNLAPFSFFSVASSQPPILSVSFTAEKDSFNNLLATKEAVVHLVSTDNLTQMNETAATLPAEISEADAFGIELIPSDMLTVPSIKNSMVRFETRLFQNIDLPRGHLVLLEVINFIFDEAVIDDEKFYVDVKALDPVARLAGNQYGKLGDLFELERPH